MRLWGLVAAAALMLATGGGVVARQAAAPLGPTIAPPATERPTLATAPAVPQPAGTRPLTKADLDGWLDGFLPYALQTGDIAGAVVVVVKDGQVLTGRGYGYADVAKRTPVDPSRTLFRPGSVSKLFTWTAVMQQVEAGKIDLDADINRYLDFKVGPKNGQAVTMRQLMTHTGGFEESAKKIMFFDPADNLSMEAYLKQTQPGLAYTPGTTPAYSNWGTTLAAYVVQRVSGQDFNDYLDQRVFAPLGMATATFRQPLPSRLKGLESQGYSLGSKPAEKWEFVGPAAAGSLSASGADMAKFMLAHLNGGELNGRRILQPQTARQMHTTSLPILPRPLNRMLLGFYESDINGRRVISHGGDTTQFHSALHLFMDEGVGIFVSVNSSGRGGAPGTIRSALFDQFADRYFPGPDRTGQVDAATAKAHAAAMAGNWENSRRFDSSFMTLSRLTGQTVVSTNGKGELVIPMLRTPGGVPRSWVEIAPWVWRDRDSHETLAAKVVDGRPVRWSVSSFSPFMVFDRAPASRNGAWLLPALYAALAILAITALLWPIRWYIRRHHGRTLELSPRSLRAFRLSRWAALAMLGTVIAWLVLLSIMGSGVANLTGSYDGIAMALQAITLVAFIGGTAAMAWNLYVAFTDKRRWTAKLWAVLLLLAALVVLWIGIAFHLFAFSVSY